jgi:2-polyprenyl-6-methoxyphenol hydroxylase-like FAD-dependent oxidoreductase
MIETPVLIAGGGPVGLTLALALSRKGVRSLLADPGEITPVDLPEGLVPFTIEEVRADPLVSLRPGWRLFGFERFADGVTAHLMQVGGDGQQQVRAGFLVGCDGAGSLVRNFLDLDLEDGIAVAFGRGRVILAGDAAHPMPPASQEGLALAVADALQLAMALAECDAGAGDLAPLQGYAQERRDAARLLRSGNPSGR